MCCLSWRTRAWRWLDYLKVIMMKKHHLLYLIIILEGYIVLASELIAMRQLVSFVGSGTEIIAIVVSAVLLPLAFGYHYGGQQFQKNWKNSSIRAKPLPSIRKMLLSNFLCAASFFVFGLSLIFLEMFFSVLTLLHVPRILQTLLYVISFLVYPIFLLGQTVPLVSHYWGRKKLSEATGRILFFSTLGSFFGSIFSTLVLMNVVGVHYTVLFTISLLLLLVALLVRRGAQYKFAREALVVLTLLVVGVNSGAMMQLLNIVSDNGYNTIAVVDMGKDDTKMFVVNRSASSKISRNPDLMLDYVQLLDEKIFTPMQAFNTPQSVLIIGSGGFTMGLKDTKNYYTYVDIDKDIKDVAEKHFLMQKLTPNKQFVALSARAFVHQAKTKYDVIVVDAYTNMISVPMEVVTQEFWKEVKGLLKPEGVMAANIVSNQAFDDDFSVRIDNTLRSVFPHMTRHVVDKQQGWYRNPHTTNIIYVYHHSTKPEDTTIYTDDKNTFSLDRVH